MKKATLQDNLPVFVRSRYRPIVWSGRKFKFQSHFPWQEMGVPRSTVEILFNSDQLYHDESLEVENKVGDRLAELNQAQLNRLVILLNGEIKSKTTSKEQYNRSRVRISKIEDKQRGLLRTWIRATPSWNDIYQGYLDLVLKEPEEVKTAEEEPAEEVEDS